ncbi:hypothetical protein H0H93_016721 [Arthromyces matolae]|nr:hypothetical protein H0H93_016721 [Arthromyces matolae]
MAQFNTAVGVANIIGAAAGSISAGQDMGVFDKHPSQYCEINHRLNLTLDSLADSYKGLVRYVDLLTIEESKSVKFMVDRAYRELFQQDWKNIPKPQKYLFFKDKSYKMKLNTIIDLQKMAYKAYSLLLCYSSDGARRNADLKNEVEERRRALQVKRDYIEDIECTQKIRKLKALARMYTGGDDVTHYHQQTKSDARLILSLA